MPRQLVISVPHNGTRTLVHHYPKTPGIPGGAWWHFGRQDRFFPQLKPDTTVHIPLRHPRAVAYTWARRGKALDALFAAYASMFTFIAETDAEVDFHPIERYALRIGADEPGAPPLNFPATAERIRREILAPHRAFFAAHGYA